MADNFYNNPAAGALAAGRGLGDLFRSAAMGDVVRKQSEIEAAQRLAAAYNQNMLGNLHGAQEYGQRITNDARTAPIDPALPAYTQQAMKYFQATGDNNAHRIAQAALEAQTQALRDKAEQNIADLDLMNRYNTIAKPGETYEPFRAVGRTGAAINQATGGGTIFDAALRKIYEDEAAADMALTNARRQAAASAPARGAAGGGAEGALTPTILLPIAKPKTDSQGRPARNILDDTELKEPDPVLLQRFFRWANSQDRKPTAKSFQTWEALQRPDAPGAEPDAAPPGVPPPRAGGGAAQPAAPIPPRAAPVTGRPGGAAPTPTPQAAERQRIIEQARMLIKPKAQGGGGKDPEAVKARLRAVGIDPAGL